MEKTTLSVLHEELHYSHYGQQIVGWGLLSMYLK